MSQNPQKKAAEEVDWSEALQYLQARGWRRVTTRSEDVGVLRKEREEIKLPLSREFDDYAEVIATAAATIGRLEGRSADAVIVDLRRPAFDVVRFAQDGESTLDGTISFDEGAHMVHGARTVLLAAACDADRPHERFHRRMTYRKAMEFVAACRLGQTEKGSFVVPIWCPVQPRPQEELATPFGRRTVEQLFRSVRAVIKAMRQGARRDMVEEMVSSRQQPDLSANLSEALAAMAPSGRSELVLRVSWSPRQPPPPDIPAEVRVDHELFDVFQELGQRLRPARKERPASVFVGRVVRLVGEDNEEGRLQGEVEILTLDEEETVRATCDLNPSAYAQAILAHQQQSYLRLRGRLIREARGGRIEDVDEVAVLPL